MNLIYYIILGSSIVFVLFVLFFVFKCLDCQEKRVKLRKKVSKYSQDVRMKKFAEQNPNQVNMHTYIYTEPPSFSNESNICTICSQIMIDKMYQINCGDRFHKDCLLQWIKSKDMKIVTCPNCRMPIVDSKKMAKLITRQVSKEKIQQKKDSSATNTNQNNSTNRSSIFRIKPDQNSV